jgi:hypothetical protein
LGRGRNKSITHNAANKEVITTPTLGQARNKFIPDRHQPYPVILSSEKGQSQNDLITILYDEGYMQILREKLRLITDKRKELNLA